VFEVKRRAARKARNPRTGQRVDVPEKFVVTFKPGKEMEERVRQLERQAAEAAAKKALEMQGNAPAEDNGSAPAPSSESTETYSTQQTYGTNPEGTG
jgi:integration host factor subunit beta